MSCLANSPGLSLTGGGAAIPGQMLLAACSCLGILGLQSMLSGPPPLGRSPWHRAWGKVNGKIMTSGFPVAGGPACASSGPFIHLKSSLLLARSLLIPSLLPGSRLCSIFRSAFFLKQRTWTRTSWNSVDLRIVLKSGIARYESRCSLSFPRLMAWHTVD